MFATLIWLLSLYITSVVSYGWWPSGQSAENYLTEAHSLLALRSSVEGNKVCCNKYVLCATNQTVRHSTLGHRLSLTFSEMSAVIPEPSSYLTTSPTYLCVVTAWMTMAFFGNAAPPELWNCLHRTRVIALNRH